MGGGVLLPPPPLPSTGLGPLLRASLEGLERLVLPLMVSLLEALRMTVSVPVEGKGWGRSCDVARGRRVEERDNEGGEERGGKEWRKG